MGGLNLIQVEQIKGIEQEYLQCSSCLKNNDELKMFKLIIGKDMRQTTTIKLCEDCLRDLRDDIKNMEIGGSI